jgi:Leu/Phe-tRNA-protein transferase
VQTALNFEAKNDLVAFAQAQKMRASHTVEVWQGERRIGRIENQSES